MNKTHQYFGVMICIPIIAKNTDEAIDKIVKANSLADILELRLDLMESFRFEDMIPMASKPLIVTYRSKKEGGEGSADYGTRTHYLLNAIEAGADFVDVEYSMPLEFRQEFLQSNRRFKVIISTHILNGTPTTEKLENILTRLSATGANIVKIVTQARTAEDNLRVLDLIPMAQKLGVKLVTFCMGPKGRISRIASPLLGGYLTFASLEQGEESADGQIQVTAMKKILDTLTA